MDTAEFQSNLNKNYFYKSINQTFENIVKEISKDNNNDDQVNINPA